MGTFFLRSKIQNSANQGFTLVEILMVTTIISILFVIVLVGLKPLWNFAEARNARRWSHINSLSNAFYTYIVDNKDFPPGISDKEYQIGSAEFGCNVDCPNAQSECLDILPELKQYLEFVPADPYDGTSTMTKYSVRKNKDTNAIIVRACQAENGTAILMAR